MEADYVESVAFSSPCYDTKINTLTMISSFHTSRQVTDYELARSCATCLLCCYVAGLTVSSTITERCARVESRTTRACSKLVNITIMSHAVKRTRTYIIAVKVCTPECWL